MAKQEKELANLMAEKAIIRHNKKKHLLYLDLIIKIECDFYFRKRL